MAASDNMECIEIQEDEILLPMADDWHQHLRQGEMSEVVVPQIYRSGIRRCIVMPNTIPPIANTEDALRYKSDLEKIDNRVEYKMLLYLTPELTPEEIEKAASTGYITGVKSYPRGVTTNSDTGVESYEIYYPVFRAMEKVGMILHLHGEVPNECVMLAEALFLDQFEKLAKDFPNLRIVLEHVSTKEAVDMVKKLGKNVAASVTAHHLDICIDQVVGCCHHFCKPVPKLPRDRDAIRAVVFDANPKFYFGSDSAPHPRSKKENVGNKQSAAGVFTGGLLLQYLAETFGQAKKLSLLSDFVCKFGAEFLGHPVAQLGDPGVPTVRLYKQTTTVPETFGHDILGGEHAVVPFRAGQMLDYSMQIIEVQ